MAIHPASDSTRFPSGYDIISTLLSASVAEHRYVAWTMARTRYGLGTIIVNTNVDCDRETPE
jgi:hypothetical protein